MSTPIVLKLTDDSHKTWIHRTDRWSYTNMVNPQQFVSYCFAWLQAPVQLARAGDPTDHPGRTIVVGGIREPDIVVPPGALGVLLCCEHCTRPNATTLDYHHHYKHGDTGDPGIHIYFYNHHSRIQTARSSIIIPFVYLYVSYFRRMQAIIRPRNPQRPFRHRKFCIITTIQHPQLQEWLKRIGPCDHIGQFRSQIKSKSCYHSQELIDLLSQYKFVFCAENASHPGYMTEKVFNAFYARSVPIYLGPPDTLRYLNPGATVICPSAAPSRQQLTALAARINTLTTSPLAHQAVLDSPKIAAGYDDENYETRLREAVGPWLINMDA
jgi:hypothetical protein